MKKQDLKRLEEKLNEYVVEHIRITQEITNLKIASNVIDVDEWVEKIKKL